MSNYTIGPGKDFATLQAWADSVVMNGDTSPIVADCYAGSDLGPLGENDWPTPSDGVTSTLIRAAVGNQHNGRDMGHAGVAYASGQWFINDFQNLTVNGLRIEGGTFIRYASISGPTSYSTWTNNLFVRTSAQDSQQNNTLFVSNLDDTGGLTLTVTYYNNVILYQSYNGVSAAGVVIGSESAGPATTIGFVYNNTVVHSGGSMQAGIEMYSPNFGGGDTINATVKNNLVVSASGAICYTDISSGVATITGDYNLSSDATANDFGGTHNQINKSLGATVVSGADPRLRANSAALNTGTTIGLFNTDIVGTIRPQGSAWDMGAFEMVGGTGIPAPPGGGGRFWAFRRR